MKLLALALVALTSCPPPAPPLDPPDVTSPDASAAPEGGPEAIDSAFLGDVYDRACATLNRVQCNEGAYPQCAEIMRAAASRRLVDFHPACVTPCKTRVCVRACGREIQCLE